MFWWIFAVTMPFNSILNNNIKSCPDGEIDSGKWTALDECRWKYDWKRYWIKG